MRKNYIAPQVKVHGSVEELTQVVGNNATQDVLIFNGEVSSEDNQSQDLDINIG